MCSQFSWLEVSLKVALVCRHLLRSVAWTIAEFGPIGNVPALYCKFLHEETASSIVGGESSHQEHEADVLPFGMDPRVLICVLYIDKRPWQRSEVDVYCQVQCCSNVPGAQ